MPPKPPTKVNSKGKTLYLSESGNSYNSGESRGLAAPRVTATYTPISGERAGIRTSSLSNGAKIGANEVAKKTPQITSSNTVLSDKNKQDARSQAGAALTADAGNYSGFQLNPMQQANVNLMSSNNNANNQDYNDMANMFSLKYDQSIRRSNANFDSVLSDLEGNFNNDIAMATQQAAALNPYSEAAGAMTANNFRGAIQGKYQDQVLKTQQQAQLAEEALRTGEMEAYMSITQQMKQSNRTFQENMMKFMLDANKEFNQNQQFERSFGLQQQKFNLEASQAYEGNFMDFVDTFGADPAFQSEIDNYFKTGEITEALMPLIERGMKTGLSAGEALSVAQYETQNQTKLRQDKEQFDQQMSLGWYNAETSRMNSVLAANKATADAAGKQNSTLSAVNSRTSTIINKGKEALSRLLDDKNGFLWGETGFFADVIGKRVSSSAGGDLNSVYETMRSGVSFSELAQMRAESPTGGALGSVSNIEIGLLSSAEGALDIGLQRNTQITNVSQIMAAQMNTETAIALDARVRNGEIDQNRANQIMAESYVDATTVLEGFKQEQKNNAYINSLGGSGTQGSTSPIGNYLGGSGY